MNDKNLDQLISAAAGKLGTSPEALRRTLDSGDMKGLTAGLSKSDKAKLRQVLENKELMNKLKNASEPQDVLRVLNESSRKQG